MKPVKIASNQKTSSMSFTRKLRLGSGSKRTKIIGSDIEDEDAIAMEPLVDSSPLERDDDSDSITSTNLKASSKQSSSTSWHFFFQRPTSLTTSSGSRRFNLNDSPTGFPVNIVRNQKYSLISFLPIILYEQFRFFFNLYFLLVSLSQLIKVFQVGYIISYFGPLIFVLGVTISKEAYDDYVRYCRDKEANSQPYQIITESGLKTITSADLKVGDLVLVPKNIKIPADCIFMRTDDESGSCFIRTDQLDGETDWKLRLAVPTSQLLANNQSLLSESAIIYAEKPHKDIHNFVGTIKWRSGDSIHVDALNVENMLWMNTINASETVCGLVIYTGQDTRAVMNTSFASTIVGLVDLEVNQLAKILALVTFILSITMVALDGFKGLWWIYALRFLILFSSIIPISLRVNLDMGKTFYGYLISSDRQIPGTIVRTSTIPEELGRVDYLLTDKTGTLTRNEMEMKKFHMGTMQFDGESMEELKTQLAQSFALSKSESLYTFKRHQGMAGRIKDIVCALSLCHNVTPTYDENGVASLQAASPDEIAIVKWTSSLGMTLKYRDLNCIRLEFQGLILEYKVMETFPFTSESKRMGIILQNTETKDIVFFQKGADSIMKKIVRQSDWLDEECANMAREGLRTLVIGRKNLSLQQYYEFRKEFDQAKTSLTERAENIQRVVAQFLERDLELLGLTGVEDQLQHNVKLTLELLRNAGLKIWMLTGDKIETATNIAVSSKLFARNQPIIQIEKIKDLESAFSTLDSVRNTRDCCIVIDGESLQFYLDHAAKELIDVSLKLPAVVCSRCTPTQKADIVSLINFSTKKRTCAIGDGGNDVSMIQAAHVGIGIVGKEGKQASLAADFSITQFSHIARLLLWHGRNSYKRTSKLAHFVIHRGLIISVMQAVFSSLFYFAPIALFQGFILVGYTTIYTMAPVFSLVYDQDINEETAMVFPELYKDLQKGRALSYKTFFIWLFISVYQGGVIMILAIWLFEDEFIRIVSISFTALIFNELIMVCLEITTWHRLMILAQIGTGLIYIISMRLLPSYFDLGFIGTYAFVWKVCLIVTASSAPIFLYSFIKSVFAPSSYSKL